MPAQFKLTVVSLHCVYPFQPGKSETVRLNIVPSGYCAYSGIRTMNNGVDWKLNKTFVFRQNEMVLIEGLINTTRCLPIFLLPIPAKQQALTEKTFRASDNTPYYKLKYKVEADTTDIVASTNAKTFGSTTRYVQSDGWGGLQLYLNSSDVPNVPYTGKYTGDDEEDSDGNVLANYCGPTAGKNIAVWYGTSDKSYTRVGQLMRTNNYFSDPELIGITMLTSLVFDPVLMAAAITALNVIKPGGTLPKNMKEFLDRTDVRPANLSTKWKNSGNSPYLSRFGLEYEVRSRMKYGRPVVALIYTSTGSLHWLLIIGFFRDGGKWKVRLANESPVNWSDFCDMWYLSNLSSPVKDVLKMVHIYPFTRMYY